MTFIHGPFNNAVKSTVASYDTMIVNNDWGTTWRDGRRPRRSSVIQQRSWPRSELGTYRSQEELLFETICLVRLAFRVHATDADDADQRPTLSHERTQAFIISSNAIHTLYIRHWTHALNIGMCFTWSFLCRQSNVLITPSLAIKWTYMLLVFVQYC
jgi:hypothetical protein